MTRVEASMPDDMPQYAVQRCRKNGKVYGSLHGSDDCNYTICGVAIDENWWILSNDSSRYPTCKKCRGS